MDHPRNHHECLLRRRRSGQRRGAWMEEARAFSELAKQGWKPKTHVVFAVWDGEEPVLGSTEWVELTPMS